MSRRVESTYGELAVFGENVQDVTDLCIRVNRSATRLEELNELIAQGAAGQAANNRPVTVDKNWVIVEPVQIGGV